MANQNPAEELIEQLRAQFGRPLGESAESLVRRFLDPFALVPKAEFDAALEALAGAQARAAALEQRVAALEALNESRQADPPKPAGKKKKKSAAAKSKSGDKTRKKAGKKTAADN